LIRRLDEVAGDLHDCPEELRGIAIDEASSKQTVREGFCGSPKVLSLTAHADRFIMNQEV